MFSTCERQLTTIRNSSFTYGDAVSRPYSFFDVKIFIRTNCRHEKVRSIITNQVSITTIAIMPDSAYQIVP
jgi:hypothetical protein